MYQRHEIGKSGEDKATEFLQKRNYTIIKRNFQCRQGEIDIIAFDNCNQEYVFIEVKTRSNFNYGKPIEAVNSIKQKHIVAATKYYIYANKIENKYMRFDIITIYKKRICHYKNCEFCL